MPRRHRWQALRAQQGVGKRTFATGESLHRIHETELAERVSHRVLTSPQLGAPGVSAHEMEKRSGFKVEYGPMRACDLPHYLLTHQSTPDMRRVRFGLADGVALIPVEVVGVLLTTLA